MDLQQTTNQSGYQSDYQSGYQNQTTYQHLPVEMILHILDFVTLETLVDTVRYLDKKHRNLVINILKNYKLKQQDCDSYWFDYIKNKNTQFLHTFLKPQNNDTMLRSHSTNTNSLSWFNYIGEIINISIIKNNSVLFGHVLTKYFTYKNIRQYITDNCPKWYLSIVTLSFIKIIHTAIQHNSLLIIRLLLEFPDINFKFNKNDPDEKTYSSTLFYKFAEKAIVYNRVDILKYFALRYKFYTNEQYNSLLVLCSMTKIVNKAYRENKPNVMEFIISIFTDNNPFYKDNDGNPYHITENCITQCRINLIDKIKTSHGCDINLTLYFLTKFTKTISIEHYTKFMIDILELSIYNNNTIKKIFILYLDTYTIFPECILYTPEELLINDNLMVVIENIKTSLIYRCFIISINTNNTEILSYLKEILLTSCFKYNITKEMFVKYLVLDCIKHSIIGMANCFNNVIQYKTIRREIYTILIQDLPSIYNIDIIESIMNILTCELCYVEVNYEYFHNLFLQKSVLTRHIYKNLLRNNLYLSIKHTHHGANKVLEFIILKLKEMGETNICKDNIYEVLFINCIKNKYIRTIKYLFENGFDISQHNYYSHYTIKTKCYDVIKFFAENCVDFKSHEDNLLHYILKQKTIKFKTLALQIKQKLSDTNKLQEYLDWETNLDYKTKFLNL